VIILFILVWGMAAGWVANLILGGGGRPDNWAPLLIAGLVGSFVGGLIFSLISGDGLRLRPSGIIGSILGAIIVLLIMRGVQGKKTSQSGRRRA
jgi:uncharacterized membrane protein YeaQ/YmgE (transglycosylase-associated protein family)